jgi:hypothetical protein
MYNAALTFNFARYRVYRIEDSLVLRSNIYRTPKPKPVTGSDEKSGIPVKISLPFLRRSSTDSFDFTKDKESFPALLKEKLKESA